MTEYVEPGEDDTFYSAEDGDTGTFGLGGIGSTAEEYELSNNRAEAAANAAIAGDLGCWAETWTEVHVRNPYPNYGEWTQTARITVDGSWSAFLDSIAGGSEVLLTAFVRDWSGNLDSNVVLHKDSGLVDLWSGNDTYSIDLYGELETSSRYEVGIRAQTTAQALTYSQGMADCHTDDSLIQYAGRHEYDSLELTWL